MTAISYCSPSFGEGLSDRDMLAAYCLGYYVSEFKDPELGIECGKAEQGESNFCSAEVVKKNRLFGYLRATNAFERGDVWAISLQGMNAYRNCMIEGNSDTTRKHSKKCFEQYGYTSKEGTACAQSLVLPSCVPLKPCYNVEFLPF